MKRQKRTYNKNENQFQQKIYSFFLHMEVCVTFKKTQKLLKLLFSKRIIISSFTLCVTSFLRKEKRGGGIGGFRDSGFFL